MDETASDVRATDRQRRLERQGSLWEYATTVWNGFEVFVTVGAGLAAHSLALVAFGLDSCIEVFASLVVLWHLGGATEQEDPARARRAMRLIGWAFVVLGAYLVGSAVHGFAARTHPDSSPVGTVFMAATVVMMFVFAWGKRRTGLALGNRPLIANATMGFLDGCLAAGVFTALVLDTTVGWWWADPLAAGLVAIVALSEAREAFTHKGGFDGEIARDDPRAADVCALLDRHRAFADFHSPPEDVHALDLDGLLEPNVTFFTCREDGALLGIGAIRTLDDVHAELKSMHTVEEARGRGVGRAMVEHLLGVARERGVERVSIETGTQDAFAPARALYARLGFEPCPPFGDYVDSRNSVCMTLRLDGPR
jgi:putative acetyltransferase